MGETLGGRQATSDSFPVELVLSLSRPIPTVLAASLNPNESVLLARCPPGLVQRSRVFDPVLPGLRSVEHHRIPRSTNMAMTLLATP